MSLNNVRTIFKQNIYDDYKNVTFSEAGDTALAPASGIYCSYWNPSWKFLPTPLRVAVVRYCLQVEGDIDYAVSSYGTLLFEQLMLFCLFMTSSKILSHLHCNHASDSSTTSIAIQ